MRTIHSGFGIAAVLVTLLTGACTNPQVPEGHEGYIYHVPLLFGQMEYRETLRGPASTGLSWRLYVETVDMRVRNFAESFQLLTSDNLSVSFEVNTRISIRPNESKRVIEQFGGENWYDWNVKEPLRTIVRETITAFSATDIQIKTDEVRLQIEQALKEKYKDEPFDIVSVAIGHITFPKEVTDAIEKKIAKKQELQRQQFLLEKTRKEAAISVLEALKIAKQQRIISETLDPLYVQKRAVDVYRKLASAPNKTVIVLPNSADGTGMPKVLTKGAKKLLSPEDERLLQRMEKRYMKIASESSVRVEEGDTAGGATPPTPEGEPSQDGDDSAGAPSPTGAEAGGATPTPAPAPAGETPPTP